MVTEKKPAAPAASDKSAPAKASSSAADKAGSVKSPLKSSGKGADKKNAANKASPDKASPDKASPGKASPDKASSDKASPYKASTKSFPWFKTIFLLLLIASLAWFGWMQWQQRAVLTDVFNDSLTRLSDRVEQQQQALLKIEQGRAVDIDQLTKQLYSLRLMANRQAEQILVLGTATRGDWLLAEAAYLVRLANQRLQVERGVDNPLAILETVDDIFVQLNDPELLAVRSAVAVDIAALRMTEKVDREGIYLELQAISSALETLSILEPHTYPEIAQSDQGTEQAPSSLAETFERFSDKLGKLIVLQKRQQPIEPLLSQAEQTMVRQNLYLLLEQAQSALLREEQSIFNNSLNKAEILLRRYFQLNSESQALITGLQALADKSVVQDLPDISASHKAIQTALSLRHSGAAEDGAEK
jgi:uroporphyrin-3 C-methyltransferase